MEEELDVYLKRGARVTNTLDKILPPYPQNYSLKLKEGIDVYKKLLEGLKSEEWELEGEDLQENPLYMIGIYNLGCLYLFEASEESSINILKSVENKKEYWPDNYNIKDLYLALAFANDVGGNIDEAIDWVEKGLEEVQDPELYLKRGSLYMRKGYKELESSRALKSFIEASKSFKKIPLDSEGFKFLKVSDYRPRHILGGSLNSEWKGIVNNERYNTKKLREVVEEEFRGLEEVMHHYVPVFDFLEIEI